MSESTTVKTAANGPSISQLEPLAFDLSWQRFQRWWAVAVLSLIAATWRLWVGGGEFPAVAMLDLPIDGFILDRVALGAVGTALMALAVGVRPAPWLYGLLIAGLAVSFAGNQHRLQPWAYQAFLHSIAFALLSPRSACRWLTAISISVYFYSACGKFDYQFLHTVGQEFVGRMIGATEGAPSRARLWMAAVLPAAELAVAIALCPRRTRRLAGVAAIAMHGGLVAVLGPWAWGHSAGVLLWNAWLMVLAWYLFVAPEKPSRSGKPQRPQSWMARFVLTAALLLPLLERAGYWDHWLSWSLYSPHTSRADIEVHHSVLDALPASAGPFVMADDDNDQWHAIDVDRWSLAALAVPIYPQGRVQLGVAAALSTTLPDRNGMRLKLKSVSDRWDGSRSERWLQGKAEIESTAQEYWLLGQR
ncbi:MAG: MauE/DoxX family redox-associated membrane protein [Planctomycetaceae bacterium]